MKKTVNVEEVIKHNNKVFKKASKKNKIVMVAQDVLSRINSKQYNVTNGVWARIDEEKVTGQDSLQKAIIDSKVTCQCCALGGLMSSCVVFKNNVTVEEADEVLDFSLVFDGHDSLGIMELFGEKQLSMIELAFEKGTGFFHDEENDDANGCVGVDSKLANKCISFGRKYRSPKSRMIAIMKNIIANGGTFVP